MSVTKRGVGRGRGVKDYEEDDPFAYVGVRVEPDKGEDHLREMAATFIGEYRRMGWGDERILALFRNPFFRGPHAVYAARGEEYVRGLMRDD